MFLKQIIKKLIDINSKIIVRFFTNFKAGRYFLFKLNDEMLNSTYSCI